jgi:uracil permease
MSQPILQIEERPPLWRGLALSIQHVFAMFGASVLVPLLFGVNPGVVLLMNGVGTLLFILITRGKAPAYLGSSFAFLAPVAVIIGPSGHTRADQYPYALGAFVVVGLIIMAIAGLIKLFGTRWIDIVLPPAAMGPIVALIGLTLAGTAAKEAGIPVFDTFSGTVLQAGDGKDIVVFLVTLGVAVFGSILFRGFLGVIPVLIAIVVGYVLAALLGLVDFSAVASSSVFALPDFQLPRFSWQAIAVIAPAALVVITEHIGHQEVTSKIVGRDLVNGVPGLQRTLFSDGLSTTLSGFVGSVPTTTYGENIGVMAITRVYSVWVIGGAAVFSAIFAFIAPISALISSIPWSVIGGVVFLLYGMIAASGLRLLVEAKVDYARSRNLVLSSVVLVTGLSGAFIQIGPHFQLTGLTLATIVGILLGLAFWVIDRLHWSNDAEGTATADSATDLTERTDVERGLS